MADIEPSKKRRKLGKVEEEEEGEKKNPVVDPSKAQQTVTITYGDQAENHAGMEMIGQLSAKGFDLETLQKAKKKFESEGGVAELIHLNKESGQEKIISSADDAYILIFRKGIDIILDEEGKADEFFVEQTTLDPDTKAFMYGRVVNKIARHNLCFDENAQDPDYENKKGRIVPYSKVPILDLVRKAFVNYLGDGAKGLVAEGNYYYDVSKCGIGFHGDGERRKVIGVRLGASLPLHYQWFYDGKPVGDRVKLLLNHGDWYVMSEKATGFDWKKKLQYTLRHAAGSQKFLQLRKK